MDPLTNTLPLAAARRTIETALARHCRDHFQATFHPTR